MRSVQYLLCRPAPAVLSHLLSDALLSVVGGCSRLVVGLLGQGVGPPVHNVYYSGRGHNIGGGRPCLGNPSEFNDLFIP